MCGCIGLANCSGSGNMPFIGAPIMPPRPRAASAPPRSATAAAATRPRPRMASRYIGLTMGSKPMGGGSALRGASGRTCIAYASLLRLATSTNAKRKTQSGPNGESETPSDEPFGYGICLRSSRMVERMGPVPGVLIKPPPPPLLPPPPPPPIEPELEPTPEELPPPPPPPEDMEAAEAFANRSTGGGADRFPGFESAYVAVTVAPLITLSRDNDEEDNDDNGKSSGNGLKTRGSERTRERENERVPSVQLFECHGGT